VFSNIIYSQAGLPILKKQILLLIFLQLFSGNNVFAQYFTWGTEPSNTHWDMHQGNSLSLVYPDYFCCDSSYLSVFDSAIVYHSFLMHVEPHHLNIVLHPNTLISNGFVAWAPARSELFVMPSRDFYPGFWPSQLAWHEMRHYAQLSLAQAQCRKRFKILFGEQFTTAFVGLAVPGWFIEGDAVSSETAFLPTGRGRSASFSAPLFAWLDASKRIPSYDHSVLGSYNNFNPDEYLLGYWLTASAFNRYGSEFWPQVYAETFMKDNFGMFPRTFKAFTNESISLRKYHKREMTLIRDSVRFDISTMKPTLVLPVTQQKEYASYRPLGLDSSGNVIAFRKEMHGEPCFVRIDGGGNEKVIKYTHLVHDESFGFDGRYIYYAEYKPHPRREFVDYSNSYRLDCNTGKVTNFTQLKKELLPVVSPNGEIAATCSYYPDGTYCITAIHAKNRQTLGSAFFNYYEQPVSMAIDDKGNSLFLIIQTQNERKLIALNSAMHTSNVLFSTSDRNIGNLLLLGDYLYFDGNLNGNEEIYRIPISGGKPECITQTAFGAYFPASDGQGGIFYSELTSNGYEIRRLPTLQAVEAANRWEFMYNLADSLTTGTQLQCDTLRIPLPADNQSEVYKPRQHLINVHSWGPFTVDPSDNTVSPGIQFDSQNILSTLTASVFSGYNLFTSTIVSGFKTTYQGWLPVVSAGFTNELPVTENHSYRFYNSLNLNAYIPLVFTRHAWTIRLNPAISLKPVGTMKIDDISHNVNNGGIFITATAAQYTNNRNVFPRLGAFIGSGAIWQSFDKTSGFLVAGYTGLWLPGIFRHDGFRLRVGFESRDSLALPYSTIMSAPRGYNLINYPVKTFTSAEYGCPLLYPNFHLGSLFYLKRLTTNLSYDYAVGTDKHNFSSAGVHLYADMHFLRLYVPVRLIFSNYYLMPENRWTHQFGFGLDFYAY
jgi:hypothetical protein